MLAMTKAHAALGIGGLALFGSGCLHTWPESVDDISDAFMDSTVVDWKKCMDDSAFRYVLMLATVMILELNLFLFRHTFGGCFSNTAGAVLHELGHCLDLAHANEGIMARGFQDLDRVFVAQDDVRRSEASRVALPFCSRHSPEQKVEDKCPLEEDGKHLLEMFMQRQRLAKARMDCRGAFWTRSNAFILQNHP